MGYPYVHALDPNNGTDIGNGVLYFQTKTGRSYHQCTGCRRILYDSGTYAPVSRDHKPNCPHSASARSEGARLSSQRQGISRRELKALEEESRTSTDEWKQRESWSDWHKIQLFSVENLDEDCLPDDDERVRLAAALAALEKSMRESHPELEEGDVWKLVIYAQFNRVVKRFVEQIRPVRSHAERCRRFVRLYGNRALQYMPVLQYAYLQLGEAISTDTLTPYVHEALGGT